MTLLAAAIAGLLAGLFMVAGHYLAPVIIGHEMRPPWTYVWGVLFGILLPFAGWLGAVVSLASQPGAWLTLAGLIVITVGAGLGTLACYLADWQLGYRAERRRNGKSRPSAHGDSRG